MQLQHLQSWHQARHPGGVGGVDHPPLLIGRVHLLQLHQDRAAPLAEGGMAGAHGIAQVGAGGVMAVLIGKGALQHQGFLATSMDVALEAAPGDALQARVLVQSSARWVRSACRSMPPIVLNRFAQPWYGNASMRLNTCRD